MSNLKVKLSSIKMNDTDKNNFLISAGASVKPEIPTEAPPPQTKEDPMSKWFKEYSHNLRKVIGTKCPEKLDKIMEILIKELRKDTYTNCSPSKAHAILSRLNRILYFFYIYYLNITELFVISQWNEHILELLTIYVRFELKASQRLQRGRDTDSLTYSRMYFALSIYSINNIDIMLNVLLKIPNLQRKYKNILDPIFRKLLLKKSSKPLTDLEYIRNLLAFKLWKRLYDVSEKKVISNLALTELKPPNTFRRNYCKYKFLPLGAHLLDDFHQFLITAMFDIEIAIKGYFEYLQTTLIRNFDGNFKKPKKFISELCESLSISNNALGDITSTSDTLFTVDKKKSDNNTFNEDDDCIIIENDDEPIINLNSASSSFSDEEVFIDLTDEITEEVNLQTQVTSNDDEDFSIIEPLDWCKNIMKKVEEQREKEKEEEKVINNNSTISSKDINAKNELKIVIHENKAKEIKNNIPNYRESVSPVSDLSSRSSDREITSTSQSIKHASSLLINTPDSTPTYEQVDSTSNYVNEQEEIETNLQQPENELLLNISNNNKEITHTTTSNVIFEEFSASTSFEQHSGNPVILNTYSTQSTPEKCDNLRVIDPRHVEDDWSETDCVRVTPNFNRNLMEEFTDYEEVDASAESQSTVTSDESHLGQTLTIEPIIKNDYMDHINQLRSSKNYEEYIKEFSTKSDQLLQTNCKRKNGENTTIRTYTKRVPKSQPVTEENSLNIQTSMIQENERRVPLQGEKVIRFANDFSLVVEKYNLNKIDCNLFNPHVYLIKEDHTSYELQENEEEIVQTEVSDYYSLYHNSLYLYKNQNNVKKIVERQEYIKPNNGNEKPKARIFKVSGVINPEEIENPKQKRGINLTLPKLETLSLNSSFQHHFCSDINECSADCFNLEPIQSAPSTNNIIAQSQPNDVILQPVYEDNSIFKTPLPIPEPPVQQQQQQQRPPPQLPIQPPPPPQQILPAEVPYWHEIDASERPQICDHSQENCPNLMLNINLDSCSNTDQEIHLPIKKRRISSLKVEVKDELSYPSTPMISIADLESLKTERQQLNNTNNTRPFKTPAELKEIPPLPPSYLCPPSLSLPQQQQQQQNTTEITTDTNYNINHVYNTPMINYHVNNVPVINFQYNPHYQLPSIQPILLPVNHPANNKWSQPQYSYIKVPVSTAGRSETNEKKKSTRSSQKHKNKMK